MRNRGIEVAKTEILITPEQFKTTQEEWGAHYRRSYWRGLLLRENNEFFERYRKFSGNKYRGPLTPEQIQEQVAYQEEDIVYREARTKEMDVVTEITAESALTLGSRYSFAYELQKFLSANPQIRTVANIGARVDFYSAYLAPRFKDVRFQSVDFQRNLAEANGLLPQSPNWSFISGYWLNLIRSGALKADMYFCVSTSVLMNNPELNLFFDEISPHAKAFACSENWYPKANTWSTRIVPPEKVPKERPYCAGQYANYHHNYIAKLEERGFRIVKSELVPKELQFHYLQLFALKG
jgi:hypothetical protein